MLICMFFLVITSSIGLNSSAFSIVKFLMPGVKDLVKNVDFTDNILESFQLQIGNANGLRLDRHKWLPVNIIFTYLYFKHSVLHLQSVGILKHSQFTMLQTFSYQLHQWPSLIQVDILGLILFFFNTIQFTRVFLNLFYTYLRIFRVVALIVCHTYLVPAMI